MPPELEQEIMESDYAGMYVIGKTLQLFARLPKNQRKITLLRIETLLKVYDAA